MRVPNGWLRLAMVWVVVGRVCLETGEGAPRWWKGNLHTHSLWSDGDDYPEMIVAWYQRHGYHFLALSDHNRTLEGEHWIDAATNRGGAAAFDRYVAAYGEDWVERRQHAGRLQVRLRTLAEFKPRFEQPGRFLLIPGMELTDRHLTAPIHINVTNIREAITPQSGDSVLEVMQRNVDAVLAQRERTGQPMFPHLNHPNFGWGITAEELMQVRGERFFEVYNGHPSVRNEGDKLHAGTERIWDLVLTWRLAVLGLGVMYGMAVDDSHQYHVNAVTNSNSGRGWVMVRAERLATDAIIRAMEAGEFYGSSGVVLKTVRRERRQYSIEIDAQPGATYVTEFVGTRKGFDRTNEPVRTATGEALRVTHRYRPGVGEVLARVEGTRAQYRLQGDEIYVRARVTSSRPMVNPGTLGEVERAWTQPLVTGIQ